MNWKTNLPPTPVRFTTAAAAKRCKRECLLAVWPYVGGRTCASAQQVQSSEKIQKKTCRCRTPPPKSVTALWQIDSEKDVAFVFWLVRGLWDSEYYPASQNWHPFCIAQHRLRNFPDSKKYTTYGPSVGSMWENMGKLCPLYAHTGPTWAKFGTFCLCF